MELLILIEDEEIFFWEFSCMPDLTEACENLDGLDATTQELCENTIEEIEILKSNLYEIEPASPPIGKADRVYVVKLR